MQNIIYNTFKKGSTTYFNSSLFFPQPVKSNVFILYSFVRKADDYVDASPQQADEFYAFKEKYRNASKGSRTGDIIIDSFVELMKRKSFDPQWIDAFFKSMELDLVKSKYKNMDELLEYIYGSAEVIGLMMSAIMDLDPESFRYARMLGRSMQFINCIRDIKEDLEFGRTYLPLINTPLKSLDRDHTEKNHKAFVEYMRNQINQYLHWQSEAEKGFSYIPLRFLIPIKTASDMYKWTALKILNNPFTVYEKKVKPAKSRILFTILKNFIKSS